MTDYSDDERAFVRDLFDRSAAPIPADVVSGSGPTRDDYLAWNDAVGTISEVARHGEPILDADGVPTAMPAPVVSEVRFGGVAVTAAELARVGLTPGDVPNLQIIDERTNHHD